MPPAPVRWSRALRPYFDLLFPRFCTLCDQLITDARQESICERCWHDLVPDPNRCQRCSAPVSKNKAISPKRCSLCKKDWKFGRVFSLCTYRNHAAKAARRMKSSKHEPFTKEIADRLGEWFLSRNEGSSSARAEYDLLVSIPQFWVKRWRDRYNQSDVLAKVLSHKLGVPYVDGALYRTRWTEKQGTKTIEERMSSVLGSIAHNKTVDVQSQRILIVDDILTSGATANEAAKALLGGGAKSVDVIVFARGASAKQSSSVTQQLP